MEMLVISYLVVLLRGAFLGGVHRPEGWLEEVSRGGRNAMVAGGIARDATDEEIAKFRGAAGEEKADDGSLSAAQAELVALEAQKTAVAGEVSALELSRQGLTTDVDALTGQKQGLTTEVEALTAQKQGLADEVAKLEKAKKAAAAKAT